MNRKNILSGNIGKKICVYCLGLFLMALGVSFSKIADLGMSPVNAIPYIMSEIFTQLSMGKWIMIVFSIFIVLQFILMGKDVQPERVLQLICTFLFGYFTDFTNWFLGQFLPRPESFLMAAPMVYGIRLVYMCISMALIALGILLYLAPELISMPGEGIMLVLSQKTGKPLHIVKICFDMTVSLIALAISLAYFKGFHGIREGTIIAAFGVGKILGFYAPLKVQVLKFLEV